jgi:hypothetical protein
MTTVQNAGACEKHKWMDGGLKREPGALGRHRPPHEWDAESYALDETPRRGVLDHIGVYLQLLSRDDGR